MRNLGHHTAAITGAGSGIGRALALRLAQHGCNLALCDIDATGLAATAALLEKATVTISTDTVDVADRTQVEQWAARSIEHHRVIDLVVNNAGVAQSGTVETTRYCDYQWMLDINLWGVIHGTKAFLPHLLEHGVGHIVNVSSVFGLQSQPGVSAYNTSKFAVRGFTESLRQELDMLDTNVSATCVHPGGIRTEIIRTARIGDGLEDLFGQGRSQLQNWADSYLTTSADHAARTILDGVRRNRRRVLIGTDARLIDLEQRLFPTGYQRLNTAAVKALGAIMSHLPRTATTDAHGRGTETHSLAPPAAH